MVNFRNYEVIARLFLLQKVAIPGHVLHNLVGPKIVLFANCLHLIEMVNYRWPSLAAYL